MVGEGAAVSWFSSTQKCVTLSTTEAEYVALTEGIKEVMFMRHVSCFLLQDRDVPCMKVSEDDQGAEQMTQNPASNLNSKLIDISII